MKTRVWILKYENESVDLEIWKGEHDKSAVGFVEMN